jgi:hypothetical protein
MTTAAIVEYLDLWEATTGVSFGEQPDRVVWRWTPDDKYSAKSAYKMLHTGSIPFKGHSLIWKTWALLQVKIFLWLTFRRRHWTNDRRARHGLEAREECYLCDQAHPVLLPILARGMVTYLPGTTTSTSAHGTNGDCMVEATQIFLA